MNQSNPGERPQTASVGISEILRILNRRKILILVTTLICTVISFIYTSRLPRRYEAECSIDIDLSTPKGYLSIDSSSSASGGGGDKMASQLSILSSQSIAWDVISTLRLDQNPDFVGHKTSPPYGPLEKISATQRLILIKTFLGGLTVGYIRSTEIAQIRYKSTSPILAAQIANAVADSYMQRNYKTKYATATSTTDWLTGQLQTLRSQVTQSEQDFADFQRKTGLLQTDESHNALFDRIAVLNSSLTTAETQRIIKEIAYRESRVVDPDQITSQSVQLASLRTEQASLESQYALLKPKYGDAYPRVVQLNSELSEVKAAIAAQISTDRGKIEQEYKTAVADEDKLRGAVNQQKTEIFAMNDNALQYAILQRQVESSRNLYEDLTRKLQEARLTSGLSSDTISVVDPALTPYIPVEPRKTLNVEAGFAVGLLVGIALAFLLESVNAKIRSIEDVQLYTGLPVIGLIPHVAIKESILRDSGMNKKSPMSSGPRVDLDPQSHFAESFRSLRSAILLSSAGAPPQLILVCSAWPKEGKSTVSINLATVLAQAGKKVLLVDGDLRRPSLHQKLGQPTTNIGLSGLLTRSEALNIEQYVSAGVTAPTLDFLQAGPVPPSSAELLMSSKMNELITEWRSHYDFIVMDTAPVLMVSDSSSLASMADTSILVARASSTRRQSLRALRDEIVNVRGKIAGVLLNDIYTTSGLYYDYYGVKGHYGTYYSGNDNA
jgi:polysaccharide biosynthesis transport protein